MTFYSIATGRQHLFCSSLGFAALGEVLYLVIKWPNKPAAEVDIAVLIDGELKDLIRQIGLEIPRKATRPDLVALLRASLVEDKKVSEPTSTSLLAANECILASLCSALSELTDVVRELKTELHEYPATRRPQPAT